MPTPSSSAPPSRPTPTPRVRPKLRVIGRAGVGVDNIDTDAATHRGIVVMNTPGANAVAVAELTLGLMISLARSIPRANSTMHAGKWEKKSLQGSELRGKTLGIVGLGRIGLEVARRAASFGMDLLGYDPFVAPVIARENDVTLVPIDEIFKTSDYLTLHVGLTTQTEGLINQTSLRIMKKGIRIINCARGELIVDERSRRSPQVRPRCRRRSRRLPPGAPQRLPLLQPRQRHPLAAHRRLDRRSPGGHRHPARLGPRLPQARRRPERRQLCPRLSHEEYLELAP